MEIVNLMPISRAEILGKEPTFLKMAFNSKLVKPGPDIVGDELVRAVLVGGYPEMLRREDFRRRQAWARDYVKAIVQRDVFCFSPAQRDKKTIHWQTEQNEGSEGGEAGAVGVASAKHALSFGARLALIRTDSTRPALWAGHPCEPKWGQVARLRAT